MLSRSKKLALLLNSSISVNGQAGAVDALNGRSQEQSKNSSSSSFEIPLIGIFPAGDFISPNESRQRTERKSYVD